MEVKAGKKVICTQDFLFLMQSNQLEYSAILQNCLNNTFVEFWHHENMPYNVDPLKPHFYIVTGVYKGIYYFSNFAKKKKNINYGFSTIYVLRRNI